MPNLPSPLPYIDVASAVEKALKDEGVIPAQTKAAKILDANGLSVEDCAAHLANLVLTAKDPTKLRALERAFALHGVDFERKEGKSNPTFVFNIQTDNVNQLFAPTREFEKQPTIEPLK